jgi:hypothetical protein
MGCQTAKTLQPDVGGERDVAVELLGELDEMAAIHGNDPERLLVVRRRAETAGDTRSVHLVDAAIALLLYRQTGTQALFDQMLTFVGEAFPQSN